MTSGATSSSPRPNKIDSSSPFYLGPQEKPEKFITPVRLKLDNFDDWANTICVALSSRRKFGYLDGTINDVIPPATKDDSVTIHFMLVSWLMNSIDHEVRSLLSNYDNAKCLWDDLNERFCLVNGPGIQQLKAEINRCEQSKTMTVAVYFGKLKVCGTSLLAMNLLSAANVVCALVVLADNMKFDARMIDYNNFCWGCAWSIMALFGLIYFLKTLFLP